MFKVRMQGQYGRPGDKKLRAVVSEMWSEWGFRKVIMRGYWITVAREIPAYAGCVPLIVAFSHPYSSFVFRFYAGRDILPVIVRIFDVQCRV